ncbi:serine C-palmitoyltransferase LCB2 [Sugiyamaella lignohabitans]|uniref:Serine C-palmitoyltransferase LCB2 n=1 Tax=Sugiyamaella lignohabitans TaxID=796027 RepID=A0A161HMC6_9ASCO|nr:serine C-palmitoyltransferase LCB2 [Sugiyamaella lignohabitans]ANB14817.1 serine C-palmitoyltransferase LCB2 [Sugiyamaella lignohabitans]
MTEATTRVTRQSTRAATARAKTGASTTTGNTGVKKDAVALSKENNGTSHSHTALDPLEFGVLESTDHLYAQQPPSKEELRPHEEDLPKYHVFLGTYISYLILIIIGHIRDFWSKHLISSKSASGYSKALRPKNGYAPLMSDFDSFYTRRLKSRLNDCFARPTTGVPGRFITILDREPTSEDYSTFNYPGTTSQCLNLSSYNYLGFAQSVGQCTDAAEKAILENGIIAGAPRAAGGTLDMHYETEQIVAEFVGKESAMLCSMGYATNANIFSNLVDKHCLVISDELNHASIRFGVRVSGAVIKIFKHNDMDDLEQLIREQISQGQPRTHRPWKKILIVVEGLYSMEGTMCNLPKLIELREKYKIYLFVDEAHSIGAMGPTGRGVCDFFNVSPASVDILMGTLTKSFGATGGYIAADRGVIDRLKIHNMANCYAEAVTPPVLAQIQSSLLTIANKINPGEGTERLQRLSFNSRYLRLGLKKLGFIVYGAPDSPIIPVMLYQPSKMPAFSRAMLRQKIAVVVVGYPATPLTSSRVRYCVSSALTKSDLDRLLRATAEVGEDLNLKMSQEIDEKTGQLRREQLDDFLPTLVDDCRKTDWE